MQSPNGTQRVSSYLLFVIRYFYFYCFYCFLLFYFIFCFLCSKLWQCLRRICIINAMAGTRRNTRKTVTTCNDNTHYAHWRTCSAAPLCHHTFLCSHLHYTAFVWQLAQRGLPSLCWRVCSATTTPRLLDVGTFISRLLPLLQFYAHGTLEQCSRSCYALRLWRLWRFCCCCH